MVMMVVMMGMVLPVCSRHCISTGGSAGHSSNLALGGGGSGPAGFPTEVASEAFLAWASLLPPPPLAAGSKGEPVLILPPPARCPGPLSEPRKRRRGSRQGALGQPPAPGPPEQ